MLQRTKKKRLTGDVVVFLYTRYFCKLKFCFFLVGNARTDEGKDVSDAMFRYILWAYKSYITSEMSE